MRTIKTPPFLSSVFSPPLCAPASLHPSTTLAILGLQRKEDLLFCCQLQTYPWLQVGTRGNRCELLAALQLSKGVGFLWGSWVRPATEEQGDREEGGGIPTVSAFHTSDHAPYVLSKLPDAVFRPQQHFLLEKTRDIQNRSMMPHRTQQCSSFLISERSTSLCTNHDTQFFALFPFLFVRVSATTQSLTIELNWKLALSQVIVGFVLVDRPTWAVLLWILYRSWDQKEVVDLQITGRSLM